MVSSHRLKRAEHASFRACVLVGELTHPRALRSQTEPASRTPAHIPSIGGRRDGGVDAQDVGGCRLHVPAQDRVAGDGDRSLSTPLTRYYAETGTPPGRWMGSGVKDLGLQEGTEVTEAQLALLIGHGRHRVTGDKLGRAYPVYNKDPDDPTKKLRKAVAGFDYTFSMPKSASVLWAVADAGTQAIIADAHHAAVRDVVDFMERELASTRMGAGTPDGAVAQVETTGFIAAAYDHWDSRAGDPHLHTHVVINGEEITIGPGDVMDLDPGHDAWTVGDEPCVLIDTGVAAYATPS